MNRVRMLVCSMFLMACGSSPSANQGCPSGVLVIATTPDYSASGVGVLPLDGSPPELLYGSELGGDPALATSQGRHFFIARDRDLIFEIDGCGRAIGQYSARLSTETAPTDPQDVAVASDSSLWVARFLAPSALIIDAHGAPATALDMSSLDADGNPDMSSVRTLGNRAFFTLARLTQQGKNFVSIQPSQMAVVDTTTRAITSVVTLAGRNPSALMMQQNTLLWLADSGSFSDAAEIDAGIEVFDTEALTTKLLLDEPALGGSAVAVAVSGTCGVAIIADATAVNNASLVSFTIGGTVAPALGPTSGFELSGLLWTDDSTVIVGDRSPGFPVHFFTRNATTCALTLLRDVAMPSMGALAFAD